MSYTNVRHIHIASVAISVTLFTLRAGMAECGVNWRRWRSLRVVPHVNDTVLLAAAITLCALSGQVPWALPWLGAKVLALLAYIGLGRMALRAGQANGLRRTYTVLALLAVGYIVGVAITRSALLGWLS